MKGIREASQLLAVASLCLTQNEVFVCGGFAAEFYLLRAGFIEGVNLNDPEVVAAVSGQIFSNAWDDHQKFIGRTVTEDNDFTKEEKEIFMNYAITRVAPIFDMYFSAMKLVVSELLTARIIDGARVRELLQPAILR